MVVAERRGAAERPGRAEEPSPAGGSLVASLVRSVRAAEAAQESGPDAWRDLALRCASVAHGRCVAHGLADRADRALCGLLPRLGPNGRLLVLLLRSEHPPSPVRSAPRRSRAGGGAAVGRAAPRPERAA
jgi:hypothetical protein